MSTNATHAARPPRLPSQAARTMRLISIPAEHGSWAFLLEAVLLGLLSAPSGAGGWLALATLGIFLVRHPLKLALADRRGGKRYQRTVWAERVALLFALVGLVAFLAAVPGARGPFWLPVVMAVPLALVQGYFDVQRQSRHLLAELAGTAAIGAGAAAIALAGGLDLFLSLGLWLVLVARSVPSILYVRDRLRLEHGGTTDRTISLVSHVAGLAAVAGLASAGVVPWLGVAAMGLLAARAAWGLSAMRRPARAPMIGVQEIVWGLVTVGLVAAGRWAM